MELRRNPGTAINGFTNAIGQRLQEALGLPAHTNLIQIRVGLEEKVEVICRYYPDAEAMERALAVLATFQVIPRDEVPSSGIVHTVEEPGRVIPKHPHA